MHPCHPISIDRSSRLCIFKLCICICIDGKPDMMHFRIFINVSVCPSHKASYDLRLQCMSRMDNRCDLFGAWQYKALFIFTLKIFCVPLKKHMKVRKWQDFHVLLRGFVAGRMFVMVLSCVSEASELHSRLHIPESDWPLTRTQMHYGKVVLALCSQSLKEDLTKRENRSIFHSNITWRKYHILHKENPISSHYFHGN